MAGVVYNPDSAHAKEMAKWELEPTRECPAELLIDTTVRGEHKGLGFRGYGTRAHSEYPQAMYYAEETTRPGDGPYRIGPMVLAENADQEAALRQRGFGRGHGGAVEALEQRRFETAELAANREYHDRKLSAKARAEAAEIDEHTARHLPEIPAVPLPPKRKAGRPPKAAPVTE
jgi:hypothetical protein